MFLTRLLKLAKCFVPIKWLWGNVSHPAFKTCQVFSTDKITFRECFLPGLRNLPGVFYRWNDFEGMFLTRLSKLAKCFLPIKWLWRNVSYPAFETCQVFSTDKMSFRECFVPSCFLPHLYPHISIEMKNSNSKCFIPGQTIVRWRYFIGKNEVGWN